MKESHYGISRCGEPRKTRCFGPMGGHSKRRHFSCLSIFFAKYAQVASKMAVRLPNIAPEWPNIGPRCHNIAPTWPSDYRSLEAFRLDKKVLETRSKVFEGSQHHSAIQCWVYFGTEGSKLPSSETFSGSKRLAALSFFSCPP